MSRLKQLNTPVFAAEGVLAISPEALELTVNGSAGSQQFTLSELQSKFPASRIDMRLTSVSGWSVRADWDGILWNDFIAFVKPDITAQFVLFSSAGGYTTCVRLSELMGSRSMLSWGVSGEPLEPEYGGPLRIVIPNLWGYKSCKWLTRIDFIEKYVTGYWEARGYTHQGKIEAGEILDVNSKQMRRINGGEVTEF